MKGQPAERASIELLRDPNLTLAQALTDVALMAGFREFLHSIKANEALSFWIETELYLTIPVKLMMKRAKEIWEKYFNKNSPYFMYIDDLDPEDLKKQVEAGPNRDIFKKAQDQTWYILTMQCWVSFKASAYWDDLLKNRSTSPTETKKSRIRTQTLENLEQFLARRSSVTTTGELELEDVIYSKDLLICFMEHLNNLNLSYLLEFSLDADCFALQPQDEAIKERAIALWGRYTNFTNAIFPSARMDFQEWAQQLHSKPNPKLFVDIRNFCWFQLHSKYFPDFLGQLIKKNYFDNVNVHYKNKFVISLAENLVQLRKSQGLVPKNKQTSLWRRLFEYKIINKILKIQDLIDRRLFGTFKGFLYSVYAEEYLEFWLEVELYKLEPAVNRRVTGMEIYKKFLDPKSETALSLDGTKHETIKSKIEKEAVVPLDVFEKAQNAVLALFRTNFFGTFLQSKLLKDHLEDPDHTLEPRATDYEKEYRYWHDKSASEDELVAWHQVIKS
jgi:hypothetical protein